MSYLANRNVTLFNSTFTASTLKASIMTYSTMTGSTITTSSIVAPAIVGTVIMGQNATYPNRYLETGTDATNSMYLDFHSNDAALPDYSTRIQSYGGATTGTGTLALYGSTIGLVPLGGVGIGTTSATQLLHIYGTGTPAILVKSNSGGTSGNTASVILSNAAYQMGTITSIENANGYGGTWGAEMTFSTYYSSQLYERMRISATGNVGIGTSNPTYPLSLMATNLSASTGTNIATTFEIGANQGTGGVYNGQFGGYLEGGCNYGQNTYLALGYISTPVSTPTKNEMIRITDSGRVGIGITNPSQALHVNGALYLTSNPSNPGNGTSASFWNQSGIGPTISGAQFQVQVNGTTTTFAINGSGNVGIGTNSPSAFLDVRQLGGPDGVSNGAQIYFPSTYNGLIYAQAMSSSFRLKWYSDTWDICGMRGGSTGFQSMGFRYNGTETLTLLTGGNVGVGTTNPVTTLHVNSSGAATSSGILSNRYYLNAPGDNMDTGATNDNIWGPWYGVGYSPLGNPCLSGYYGAQLQTASGILMLTSDGKLGIGITTPSTTLDVNGPIARSGLKLPRVDYGTFTTGASVAIPILFNDTQYSHVEIRVHYTVSAQCQMTMAAYDTNSASMGFTESSLTTYQWNSQTSAFFNTTSGSPTTFNFANNVEQYGIDNILVMRIVRSMGGSNIGYRNHYMYDNVYCIYNVGTARGYGMGHIDNASLGGAALASFRLVASTGNISGNYTTTHYN